MRSAVHIGRFWPSDGSSQPLSRGPPPPWRPQSALQQRGKTHPDWSRSLRAALVSRQRHRRLSCSSRRILTCCHAPLARSHFRRLPSPRAVPEAADRFYCASQEQNNTYNQSSWDHADVHLARLPLVRSHHAPRRAHTWRARHATARPTYPHTDTPSPTRRTRSPLRADTHRHAAHGTPHTPHTPRPQDTGHGHTPHHANNTTRATALTALAHATSHTHRKAHRPTEAPQGGYVVSHALTPTISMSCTCACSHLSSALAH